LLKVRTGPALALDVHSKRQPGCKWHSPGWLTGVCNTRLSRALTSAFMSVHWTFVARGSALKNLTTRSFASESSTHLRLHPGYALPDTPAPCRPGWGTRTSSTPNATPRWRRIGSTTSAMRLLVEGRRLEPARYGPNRNTRHHATGAVSSTDSRQAGSGLVSGKMPRRSGA
jgi:hypothetical protein